MPSTVLPWHLLMSPGTHMLWRCSNHATTGQKDLVEQKMHLKYFLSAITGNHTAKANLRHTTLASLWAAAQALFIHWCIWWWERASHHLYSWSWAVCSSLYRLKQFSALKNWFSYWFAIPLLLVSVQLWMPDLMKHYTNLQVKLLAINSLLKSGGLYTEPRVWKDSWRTHGGLVKYCCRSPPSGVYRESIKTPARLQIDWLTVMDWSLNHPRSMNQLACFLLNSPWFL